MKLRIAAPLALGCVLTALAGHAGAAILAVPVDAVNPDDYVPSPRAAQPFTYFDLANLYSVGSRAPDWDLDGFVDSTTVAPCNPTGYVVFHPSNHYLNLRWVVPFVYSSEPSGMAVDAERLGAPPEFYSPPPIPEPASASLLALGGMAMLRRRR